MNRDLLAPLRLRFERRRPVRAGSLVVTLYGDAILPRGGSLWLGALNELMAPFGVGPGLVRTAMSRLVGEGLFARTRIGRNSYFRLSPSAAAEFAAASRRIYRGGDVAWDGRWRIAVLAGEEAKDRQQARDRLAGAGFGQLAPNVMLRPCTGEPDDGVLPHGIAVVMTADCAGVEAAQRLATGAWRLQDLAGAYRDLAADLAPIARRLEKGAPPPAAAFQLRLLLVHEWRRIVLRDPQLPAVLLPQDWPGRPARDLCRDIYLHVRDAADCWLDEHAVNEAGPLPAADAGVRSRFMR